MTQAFLEELQAKFQTMKILTGHVINKNRLFGALKSEDLSVKVFEQLFYQECEFRTTFN